MHQGATWYGGRPQRLSLSDCVRCLPSPLPQKAHVCCGQTAAWIKVPLVTEVDLGLRDIVLDGDSGPLPVKGHSPQFSANVRCDQTAGRTKMPLGIEVGLGQGDFVFDGDPATSRKLAETRYTTPTQFWPMSTVAN